MRTRVFLLASLLMVCAPGALAQERRLFELEIANRAVTGQGLAPGRPAGTITVRRGDQVVVRWKTDESVTLHLHGYNLTAGVPAGGSASMSFTARAAGRFPVEAHGIGKDTKLALTLLYVEVHPR